MTPRNATEVVYHNLQSELMLARSREIFLRAELNEAAQQFLHYARLHLKKVPPDVSKADTNTKWAQRCLLASSAAKPEDEDGSTHGFEHQVQQLPNRA